MANSNSQRAAAFLLALLFFLSTVGAAGFLIWELNSDGSDVTLDNQITEQQQIQEQIQQQEEQPVQDLGIISDFDGPVEVPELRFDDIVVGTGETVLAGDTVTIHYTGALAADGSVFDSSVSRGETATFPLDSLIPGWQEGIPGMNVGGKRRLFIPSSLGYGEAGAGSDIPPNSDLIFDIELFETTR